jgi:hypothetical protein
LIVTTRPNLSWHYGMLVSWGVMLFSRASYCPGCAAHKQNDSFCTCPLECISTFWSGT